MKRDANILILFKRFQRHLNEIEKLHDEMEEYGIFFSCLPFLDAYWELQEKLEDSIDVINLTEKQSEQYANLNKIIYDRLRQNYGRLYAVAGNIEEIFTSAYRLVEERIAELLASYPDGDRPFFSCGFSFFEVPIPKYSLLSFMITDNLLSLERFKLEDGYLKIDISELNSKFGLTGQEHDIYGQAFAKCVSFLNKKLGLNGISHSYID